MRVFVPTRARITKQITRRKFFLDHPQFPYPVTYVVPESEEKGFQKVWGHVDLYTVPDTFRFSDVRQHLVEEFLADPHHVCMDDDLVFLRRKAPLNVHQRSDMRFQDALDCFRRMELWLERGFVHGALSQRGGNNHCPDAYALNKRATDCHFYHAGVLHDLGIKINAVVLRQDFHTTLSLLELGYPNVIDHEFMTGQKDGEPGGCQVYRNHEMLEEQAHLLHRLHPDFVTVVEKERIRGFGMSTDVRIAWKKAYTSAPVKHEVTWQN